MKRSPMPRRTSRLPARRATARRSERVVDRAHLHAVHGLPCCARDLSPCEGPIEADHAAKKVGMGRKSDDRGAVPMCRRHHIERHAFAGCFRSWTAPRMRAWLDEQIENTRRAIDGARSAA